MNAVVMKTTAITSLETVDPLKVKEALQLARINGNDH